MTKPDDIPADIWDKAYDAMQPAWQGNFKSSPAAMMLHLAFARAILAERERALEEAAGVADAIEKASRDEAMDLASKEKWQTANHWNAHADGCLEVSDTIRALKEAP